MVSNSDVPIRQAEFYLYIWERRIFYIFRLLKEIDADISKIAMQRYEVYFWHCHHLSLFVTFCHLLFEKTLVYLKKNQ
jgi:hypothetical protein